ncbi:hypothetical protein DVA86_27865 [Streptomyces armeniacus]|uniref:Uncharacterized protein n=1 Tax=Streptomyces armeniacus TaxID=83291 RepID=A0A345XW58_9ACTN|nr:hypothetical protein DVA86_27865 [Streptomyces armeniacus]
MCAEPHQVQLGDEIHVGGRQMKITDMQDLPRGGKRLTFASGEALYVNSGTQLTVLRMPEGW